MAFLFPAFLAGAAAAAVPILLHLLRRETAPPLPFSAVRFLVRAPEERRARHRLREWLLLALRVAALVLLATAFARPYPTRGAAGPSGVTIVAVDTSFSLSAPGRFPRAQALAREAIDRADPSHLVGVVAFGDSAALVAEPALDRAAARAAVERLEPGYGATRYRRALDRAVAALDGRAGRLVLVTDLQRAGWWGDEEARVPADVEVDLVDTGGVTSNLAVTALGVEASRPVAVIRAMGTASGSVRARLFVDDRLVATRVVDVASGRPTRVAFDVAAPEAGVLRASVDDPVGYAADNARYAALGTGSPLRVLVVAASDSRESDALYLTRALAAHDPAAIQVDVLSGQVLAAAPERVASSAAVVVMSTRGLDRRASDALLAHVASGRGGLLVTGGDRVSPAAVSALIGSGSRVSAAHHEPATAVLLTDVRHPIVVGLGPLGLRFGRLRVDRSLTLEDPAWQVLGRFTNGTVALAERPLGRGRVLWLASDLAGAWNDWPRDPVFAPFVHEMLRYLAGVRGDPREHTVGDAPPGVPRRPGVATAGVPPRRVAVNVDPRESDPARLSTEEFLGRIRRVDPSPRGVPASVGERAEARQGYWRYLLALVFLTLVLESWVSRR